MCFIAGLKIFGSPTETCLLNICLKLAPRSQLERGVSGFSQQGASVQGASLGLFGESVAWGALRHLPAHALCSQLVPWNAVAPHAPRRTERTERWVPVPRDGPAKCPCVCRREACLPDPFISCQVRTSNVGSLCAGREGHAIRRADNKHIKKSSVIQSILDTVEDRLGIELSDLYSVRIRL